MQLSLVNLHGISIILKKYKALGLNIDEKITGKAQSEVAYFDRFIYISISDYLDRIINEAGYISECEKQ